jgi:hypothetical protein
MAVAVSGTGDPDETPPTFVARCKVWCQPGGTAHLTAYLNSRIDSSEVREWCHIRKFKLKNCVSERRIWAREQLEKIRCKKGATEGVAEGLNRRQSW